MEPPGIPGRLTNSIIRNVWANGFASDFTKGPSATVIGALPYLRAGGLLVKTGVWSAIVPAYFGASMAICSIWPSYGG